MLIFQPYGQIAKATTKKPNKNKKQKQNNTKKKEKEKRKTNLTNNKHSTSRNGKPLRNGFSRERCGL